MHRNRRKNVSGLLAVAAAVSVGGMIDKAYATTTIGSSASGVAEATSLFTSTFFDIGDAGAAFPGWGAIDFPASTLSPTIPAGQQVSAVGSDLTINLWQDFFSNGNAHNSTIPVTLDFYLATDTTTSIGSGSPLRYETGSNLTGGLNNPGGAGSFLAGTTLYSLGSASQPAITNAQNGQEISFSLPTAFNAASEAFIQSTLNTGGKLRLVVASEGTDTGSLQYFSPTNTLVANRPTMSLDLTISPIPTNTSLLYVNAATQKSATVNLGTLYNGVYTALKGTADTVPVTILNGSSTGGDTLNYKITTTTANGTAAGTNPLNPSASTQIQFGFSAADTNKAAGTNISGSAILTNQNNPSDTTVSISSNSVHLVEQRFVNAGGTGVGAGATVANDLGRVLVGATVGAQETNLLTTNTDTAGDFSLNSLTSLTLKGNSTAASFTVKDPFTNASVAVIGADTIGLPDQSFVGMEIGAVNANVTPSISGVYGDAHVQTIGGTSKTFGGQFADFTGTSVVGDGLVGEVDDARSYVQWQGYQGAAVTGNTVSPLGPGSTATLSNALSSDNIVTVGASTVNNGLRSSATVTGVAFNQGGWSQTTFTNGQVLNPDGSTSSSTINFTSTSPNKINGTYGASMIVSLQNDQTIQGTHVNDVAPEVFTLQTTVNTPAGSGAGAYSLDGGTLSAPATALTGSYSQTGGAATFASITGTGAVSVSGGTLSPLAATPGSSFNVASLAVSGSGAVQLATNATLGTQSANPPLTAPTSNVNIGSLSVTGNGTLDITNNHLIINYGAGPDPIASIAAMIVSAAYNGATPGALPPTWTGHGITSSTAAANSLSYGIGFADAADANNPAGLAPGQIEVKYTLLGDANLDGKVNGTDFAILATQFNQSATSWDQADFNYDGKTNGTDFAFISTNFNQNASQASVEALDEFAAANGLLADVPEPASMGLFAVSGLALLARRKRRGN